MALDRFIRFGDRRPTREQTELVLRNFIGDAGRVFWEGGRFFVQLAGKNSFPFKGIEGVPEHMQSDDRYHPDGRWIEVYIGTTQFDVITREHDEYTNVVADGIAAMFARFWDGELEPG